VIESHSGCQGKYGYLFAFSVSRKLSWRKKAVDEEEDVGRYWMTLRKGGDTLI